MTVAFDKMRDAITLDAAFQNACQRYHHHGGSSAAIAAAALRVVVWGDNSAVCSKVTAEISAERDRQITAEGYDTAHDDAHENFELCRAASVLALYASLPKLNREHALTFGPQFYGSGAIWPWDEEDFKLSTPRSDLIKAAALIVAEIERLDRAAATTETVEG